MGARPTLGLVLSFQPSCLRDLLPFLPLQRQQAVTRFSHTHLPPLDRGTTWSIVRLALLPQYLHVAAGAVKVCLCLQASSGKKALPNVSLSPSGEG